MGRDAETQFAYRVWREGFDAFMGHACDELHRRGQPENVVVVLLLEKDGDEGAPPRILNTPPWIGPREAVRQIVPDVPAAILAEIDAVTGDQFPVLIWSTFRDGRAPAGQVLAIDRVDAARDEILAHRWVERLQEAMKATRAMVPPDRPILYGALPECVGKISMSLSCMQCHALTQDFGAVLLDPLRQYVAFGHCPRPIAAAVLVPLCGPCAQRYWTAPSSFALETLDHAIDRFWTDGGLLMAITEDRHAFPWLQGLMERISGTPGSG
jgi:hypothetical protein